MAVTKPVRALVQNAAAQESKGQRAGDCVAPIGNYVLNQGGN